LFVEDSAIRIGDSEDDLRVKALSFLNDFGHGDGEL